MCLCSYKNIFGKPREGIHSYRFMDFAIVDIVGTIIGAYIIAKYTDNDFYKILFVLFILGIILHKLFCVDTKLNLIIFN
jgi:hypothetical protein